MARIAAVTFVVVVAASGAADVRAQDEPLGWVIIPTIDLWRPLHAIPIVDRQYDMSVVGSEGAGWLEQTNWLTDDWGTVFVAAHSDGAFERLGELQVGDRIYLYTLDYKETYEVTAIHHGVAVTETEWLAPALEGEHLSLISCEGQNRMIVEAERIQ